MLSYSSTLVLGIIEEKPVNPYEIKKLLERISIRKWLPIASSSLYATIRSLSQSGLVDCRTSREGNMPEKKVYSINEKGTAILHESLLGYLGSMELDKKNTHVAGLLICHLPRNVAIDTITKKVKKLDNADAMLKRVAASFEASDAVPYTALLTVRHELSLVQAELAFSKDLLTHAAADEGWNHFVTAIK